MKTAAGILVAVTEASKTIVVESAGHGRPWLIGTEVTDRTKFAGKAKDLMGLQPGDKVAIQWPRQENRLFAHRLIYDHQGEARRIQAVVP